MKMNKIHLNNQLTEKERKIALRYGVQRTIFTPPMRVLFILMFALLCFQFFTNIMNFFKNNGASIANLQIFLSANSFVAVALVFFFVFPPLFTAIAIQMKWKVEKDKVYGETVFFSEKSIEFFVNNKQEAEIFWKDIESVLYHQAMYIIVLRKGRQIIPVAVDEKQTIVVKELLEKVASDLYSKGIKLQVFN